MSDADDQSAELLTWVEAWFTAAARQFERIKGTNSDEVHPDVLLFIDALNNLRRGAEAILGAGHRSVRDFDRSHPGLADLRNMVEHFDSYVRGDGWRQRANDNNPIRQGFPFMVNYIVEAGGDWRYSAIMVADKHLMVGQALQSAWGLRIACKLAVEGHLG